MVMANLLWTVILGNNNTGKTTLLRCLADLGAKFIGNFDGQIPYLAVVPERFDEYKKWMLGGNYHVYSEIFLEVDKKKYRKYKTKWGYETRSVMEGRFSEIGNLIVYGYGTSRKMGNTSLTDTENQDNTASLFDEYVMLPNAEEWLIQTDYASKNHVESAKFRL